MDTIGKLRKMIEDRGWSTYRFSKECGLPEATIGNVFRRNTVPTIGTLEIMCQGLGITLSQFFCEGEMIEVTPELREILDLWLSMTPKQHEAAKRFLPLSKSYNGTICGADELLRFFSFFVRSYKFRRHSTLTWVYDSFT